MSEHQTPTDEALEDLGDAAEREAEAASEAVEDVVEEVAEAVADAAEEAQEAAAEAAETVEEAVESAAEAHPDLEVSQHADAIYNRVMERLREEGHIPTPAIAEEMAGEAEHEVEVVQESAPVEAVAEAPVEVRRDVAPVSEHWYYRPRKLFGRTF